MNHDTNTVDAQIPGIEATEDSQNILQTALDLYWTYVQPYLWMYIASVAIFLLGAIVYLFTATPLFRSTCQVHISQNQVNVVQVRGLDDPTFAANTFLNTQMILLGSQDVLDKAYETLGLNEEQRALLQYPVITNVKGTNLVNVAIISSNRELAAQAANGVVQAYINSQHNRRSDLSSSGVTLLQGQLERVTADHERSVQDLLQFKTANGIYDFDANYKALTDQLTTLQDSILEDESKGAEILALRDEIKGDPDTAVTMLPYLLLSYDNSEGGVSASNIVAEKLSHLQELALTHQMALPELTAKYGEHNLAVQIHNRVNELISKTQHDEIETGIRGLTLSVDQLKKHQAQLTQRAAEISKRMAEMDQVRGEYHRREAAVAALEKTMDMLVGRIYEIQVSDATDDMDDYAVFVTTPALPANGAFYPVKLKTLAISLFLGVALAAAASFVLVSTSTKLTSLESISGFFGKRIPEFGNVPSILTDEKEDSTLDEAAAAAKRASRLDTLQEAFRDIRTALNLSLVMRSSKVLAVCSAVSGEGKTFVACNLAKSFAQEKKRVLLLDCDLRKPDAHHYFTEYLPEEARKKGISNVLVGDCHLKDVVHHIPALGLDVATTGPMPPNPNELLSMGHFPEMLKEAKENYDLVVIDTSPVMLVSDALLIANQDVPFLLVARLFSTNRNLLRQLAAQLKQNGIYPAGLIANCADVPKNSYGSSSYGGYGYGYGGYGKYGKYGKYRYGKKEEEAKA